MFKKVPVVNILGSLVKLVTSCDLALYWRGKSIIYIERPTFLELSWKKHEGVSSPRCNITFHWVFSLFGNFTTCLVDAIDKQPLLYNNAITMGEGGGYFRIFGVGAAKSFTEPQPKALRTRLTKPRPYLKTIQLKIDTLFKAQTKRKCKPKTWHPVQTKKQKLRMAWTGQLYFVLVTLEVKYQADNLFFVSLEIYALEF